MRKLIIPPVFVLICFLLIIMFYFLIPAYNLIPFPVNLFGIVVSFSGFIMMGKSSDLFKKHKTSLGFEKSSYIITKGIYSKTRNHMYIGMFLLLLGIALYFKNLFSVLTSMGFIILMRFVFIPKEEKLMYETFGQDYLDYKNKVRRWI